MKRLYLRTVAIFRGTAIRFVSVCMRVCVSVCVCKRKMKDRPDGISEKKGPFQKDSSVETSLKKVDPTTQRKFSSIPVKSHVRSPVPGRCAQLSLLRQRSACNELVDARTRPYMPRVLCKRLDRFDFGRTSRNVDLPDLCSGTADGRFCSIGYSEFPSCPFLF